MTSFDTTRMRVVGIGQAGYSRVAARIDLAVVAQDPWFGGGARRHLEAFCSTASELGRTPTVFFLARGRGGPPLADAVAVPRRSVLAKLDALNQLFGARIASSARTAGSVWVVASAAHYGVAAALSRRPYACWVGT